MKTVLELEELANLAIKAALAQKWAEAVSLNQQVLTEDPENVEALNRLGRAHQEQGQVEDAKQVYKRVLAVDAYNTIAQKQLQKLEQGGTVKSSSSTVNQSVFLEEPGKTRSTQLVQAQVKKLSQLSSGQELSLQERHGQLAVIAPKGGLVGYLPDELASHLLNLIRLGNTYSVHLMSSSAESPTVFLREILQSPQAAKFVSFTRSHAPSHSSVLMRDDVTKDDGFSIEPTASDEESDTWDESGDDTPLDPDDDFHSISLENLREEEDDDRPYSGRDDY